MISPGIKIECGGLVGIGWLYTIVPLPWRKWLSLKRFHLNHEHQFTDNLYGWFFSSICRVKFRKINGSLGLFDVQSEPREESLIKAIRCGLNHELVNSKIGEL